METDWQQLLDWVQWPAMVVTLLAAFFVGSKRARHRLWGFWFFLASNVLWITWGWPKEAWGLIVLQLGLAALNIRGWNKNERLEKARGTDTG